MELTRKQVIQNLVMMKSYARGEDYEALKYAISSLKTDEAYQLMYEGGEIFTKADMVDMLTEIKKEIDEIPINADNSEPFRLGQASAYDKCENLILQKINELKEHKHEV